MKKILITGSPGSGKTTLSRKLSQRLSLPLHHLDLIYWKPGWQRPDPQEKNRNIEAILSQEKWIVDGVSERIFDAADTIVFLDVPRPIAYWRLFKRFLTYSMRKRPEVPDKSSELRILKKAVTVIWHFPKRHRPGILKSIESVRNVKNVAVIRSNTELWEWSRELDASL